MKKPHAHKIALCLAAVVALSGCGRKGPLIPPESLVPAPITDLQVQQMGSQFEASWSAPTREEIGRKLQNLAGFILLRHQVLPADQDCDLCNDAYQVVSHVDLDYLKDVRRMGSRYVVADRDITAGTTYRYKVRSLQTDGTNSKDSNKVQRTAYTPPPTPSLSALSTTTGITLTLSSPSLPEGTLVGYNVYRRTGNEEMPLAPLNATPLAGPSYADQLVQHGLSYSYAARTVVKIGSETVESAPSAEVKGAIVEPE